MLRSGIWKPRTRPDSFEGIGEIGLSWLMDASCQYQIPVAVEVANHHHVEAALKSGVHALWIGARTTVNPFTVQEIADALKGVKIPVMIKNPVNPDLELWLGAFERMRNAGVYDLTAIHRGFSYYNHPKYRNVPQWEIPIALKGRLPDVPLICDPSHISGNRKLLAEVAQKAMDLHADGLMLEVHPAPDSAWSDAAQQITPVALQSLLAELIIREHDVQPNCEEQLNDMRSQIENLDDQLFEMLASRMKIAANIGDMKREHGITILQRAHWEKMIHHRLGQAEMYGLSSVFVRKLMDEIHQESIRQQTRVMNPDKSS
jgi:chorismate mutase